MDLLSALSKLTGAGQSISPTLAEVNPLARLFGFQEGGEGGVQMGEGNVDPRTINVAANTPVAGDVQTVTPDPPAMGNVASLLEAQAAMENAPQRKGMFGMKGTLRDVVGLLGDAFLVQGGGKALYGPQRERERLADAMTGFTQQPQAASERVAYNGFADEATKLWNDTQTQLVNQGTLEAKRQENARKIMEDDDQRYQKYGTIFSQFAGSADAKTWPQAKKILEEIKRRGGLGEEYSVPDEYDPQLMRTYQYGGMPATQQVNTSIRRDALDQKESQFVRAEAGRMARDNPPAPRQPRAQTDLEYFQEVGRIPEARRTQAQKDFYKKYTQGTGRGSGRGTTSTRRQVTPPGTFKGWTSAPRQ